MLDTHVQTQLRGYLERLSQPVEIVASPDDSQESRRMLGLIADLTALTPLIRRSPRRDDAPLRPSFALCRPGQEPRIRFAGMPMGHEFTSLVLALLHTGGHPPNGDPATLERVRALAGDMHFESVVSLSCQSCPEVVQALNVLAVLNPGVRHTMIDGALFQGEVERRAVMSVPAVFLNGQPFAHGRMELAEILAKLEDQVLRNGRGSSSEAERLRAKAPYDVLVVGGGPAGAAAAVYAARKGLRTGVAALRLGGQLRDTVGIENFISVRETEGHALAAGLERHVSAYDIDVMSSQRAAALIPGELIEVRFEHGGSLQAKAVVLATGARWREIDVPGEREYRNKGVAYCPHCDGPLFKGRRVAVIGGGNSGVEAAIDLAGLAAHLTLIEYDSELRADAVLRRKLASLFNVRIVTGARTTEILGDGQRVTGLDYRERESGERHTLEVSGVFVQIGLVPNTDWLTGTLKLSARGEIEVDARGQTSLPGVFAAGDCTVVPYKQIIIAMGEGAKASLGACDHLIRAPLPAAA